MKFNTLTSFILAVLFISFLSCRRKSDKSDVKLTRTSGETTIGVDETFDKFLNSQIEVFKSDYPQATVNTVIGNENKLIPKFVKGELKILLLSRMLKPAETHPYRKRNSPIYTDRIAIDGLAVITNKNNTDSTILVSDLYEIMRGINKSNKKLVFDNAYSSTIRYFIDSAGIQSLPKEGVYTLNTTDDVIKYVAKYKDYYGIIGLNWLLEKKSNQSEELNTIKTLAVRNIKGKNGDDKFYKPSQENLMNGKYPFLRNIYIINAEGTNGLGTGFANWLASPRGQLIVLKSGLAPHAVAERELNYRTEEKK